jgi:hypothetical protein
VEAVSTSAANDSDEDSVGEERPGASHRFSQRVASHDAKKIATSMMAELSMVSGQIFQLWHRLAEVVPSCIDNVMSVLREKYNIVNRQQLSQGLVRKVLRSADIGVGTQGGKCEVTREIAGKKRKANMSAEGKGKRMVQKGFEVRAEMSPILVEEFFIHDRSMEEGFMELGASSSALFTRDIRRRDNSTHLVVLVHGFQGSSNDMRIIKNMLYIAFPHNLYLCSSFNEENTESSIFVLGKKLAEELANYLKDNCIVNLGRVSFIGHSLGGLVIRAALPYLEDFSNKMHLFLTLSSPHLGIYEGSSKLIRAGLWVLNNFKKSESLKQLSLIDSLNLEECALYKLAYEKGCEWFTHMVLVSSPQDLYSPHYSSRIETSEELLKFGEDAKILGKMAKRIVEGRERIHRIDVDFVLPSNNFDNWIGRAGHIEFLENHTFIRTLAYLHPEFFD